MVLVSNASRALARPLRVKDAALCVQAVTYFVASPLLADRQFLQTLPESRPSRLEPSRQVRKRSHLAKCKLMLLSGVGKSLLST